METISVITAFYKGQEFLPQLFGMMRNNEESLKKRKMDYNLEFILVNDYPDETVEIDKKLLWESDRFTWKVIQHEKNGGIHAARVTGLKAATGKYILILDQDDMIVNDFFVRQLSKLKSGDVVVANAWMDEGNNTGFRLYRNQYQYFKVTQLKHYAKVRNQIASPGQCLIRRSAIPEEWLTYITQKNGSDDLMLWVIMLSRHAEFVMNHAVLYTHKYTGSNLSEDASKMEASTIEVAGYLDKTPGVDKKTIQDILKSRKFDIELRQKKGAEKIILCMQNLDIVIPTVWWKFRSIIG